MAENLKPALLSACRLLLRPVARLLIKSGLTWKDFADASKAAFVEVATEEFGIRGRPTNLARVAILTGINRREVARQRELLADGAASEPLYMSTPSRVLSGWHQDPDYCPDGTPALINETGPAPSFTDLCARHAGDMPASALLKELRAVGAVRNEHTGQLRVTTRTYIPLQIDPESARRVGSVMEDLGTVLEHNLGSESDQQRHFERRATNDQIDPKHLDDFQRFVEQEGQAFLIRVDDWLSQHEARASNETSKTRGIRLGVGVYHIQDHKPRGRRS